MRDALTRAGIDRRTFAPGDVWLAPDENITLPERPPGQRERTRHPTRPVIVVDGPVRCADASLISILVVPTSTRVDLKSRYRITIPRTEGGLDESVAMIDMVQPIERQHLTSKLGQVSTEWVEELRAILLDNLGVLPAEAAQAQGESAEIGDIPF